MLGTIHSNHHKNSGTIPTNPTTVTATEVTASVAVGPILPHPVDVNKNVACVVEGGGYEVSGGGRPLLFGESVIGGHGAHHQHPVPPPYAPSPLRESGNAGEEDEDAEGDGGGRPNPSNTTPAATHTSSSTTPSPNLLHHHQYQHFRQLSSMDSGGFGKVAAGLLESTDGEDFDQHPHSNNSKFNNPSSSYCSATPLSTVVGSHSSQLQSTASPLVPADLSTTSTTPNTGVVGIKNTAISATAASAAPFVPGGGGGGTAEVTSSRRVVVSNSIPSPIGGKSNSPNTVPTTTATASSSSNNKHFNNNTTSATFTPMGVGCTSTNNAMSTTTTTSTVSRRPHATPMSLKKVELGERATTSTILPPYTPPSSSTSSSLPPTYIGSHNDSNNNLPSPPSTICTPKASQQQMRSLFTAAAVAPNPSPSSSSVHAAGRGSSGLRPIGGSDQEDSSCLTSISPLNASTKICSNMSSMDQPPPFRPTSSSSTTQQHFYQQQPYPPTPRGSGNLSSSNSNTIISALHIPASTRRFHYDPSSSSVPPQARLDHPHMTQHQQHLVRSSVSTLGANADLLFSSDLLAASYLDSDGPALVPMSTTIGPRSLEPSDDDEAAEDELLIKYRSYVGGVDSRPEWMCLRTFAYGHVVAFATDKDGCLALLALLKEALVPIWDYIVRSSTAAIPKSKTPSSPSSPSSTSPPPSRNTTSQRDNKQLHVELRTLAANTPQLEAGPRRDLVLTQLQAVLQQLRPNIYQHFQNAFSSRVVQFFVDTHFAPFLLPIVKGLRGHCLQMAKSGTGSRILRSLLEFCGDHITDEENGDSEEDDSTILNATASVVLSVVTLVKELDGVDAHSGDGYVYMCVLDSNANLLLQCALRNIPEEIGVFVASQISERFMEVAVHPYGARVIQCVFEEVKHPRVSPLTEQAALRLMVQSFRNIKTLIHTQFGHFVLGFAISNAPSSPEDPEFVQSGIRSLGLDFTTIPTTISGAFSGAGLKPINRLVVTEFGVNATLQDWLYNARSKFSSDVVKRAFECASLDTLHAVTQKLLIPTQSTLDQIFSVDTTPKNINKKKHAALIKTSLAGLSIQHASTIPEFGALILDSFGNCVVQTLFMRLSEDLKSTVMNALEPFLPMLIHSYHGKSFIKMAAPQQFATHYQEIAATTMGVAGGGGGDMSSLRLGGIAGMAGIGGMSTGVLGGAPKNSLHSSPRGGGSSSPSPAGSFVENRRGQVFNEFIENSRYDQKVPVQFDDIPPPPEYGADYNSDDGWDLRKRRSSVNTSAGNTSCGLGATGHFSRSDSNVNINNNSNAAAAAAAGELRIALLRQRQQNELLVHQLNYQQMLIQHQQQFFMNSSRFMDPMGASSMANMMMALQQQQLQTFMGGGNMTMSGGMNTTNFNNMGMNMGVNNNNNNSNNNNNMFGLEMMNNLPQPFATQQCQHQQPPPVSVGGKIVQSTTNNTSSQHNQRQQKQQHDATAVSAERRVSTESLTVFSSWVNQEPTPHKGADTPTLPTTVGDSLTCNPRSGLNFKLPPSTHPTGLYFNGLAAQGVDSDGGSTPATFQSIVPRDDLAQGDDNGVEAVAPPQPKPKLSRRQRAIKKARKRANMGVSCNTSDDEHLQHQQHSQYLERQQQQKQQKQPPQHQQPDHVPQPPPLLHQFPQEEQHVDKYYHHQHRLDNSTFTTPNHDEEEEHEHSDSDASGMDFEFSWESGSSL